MYIDTEQLHACDNTRQKANQTVKLHLATLLANELSYRYTYELSLATARQFKFAIE